MVYVTCKNEKEAERIAKGAIEKKLAACANIIPKTTSFYSWKGKIQKNPEIILLLKTNEKKYAGLEKFISSTHSYETPCVVSWKIQKGRKEYLEWLESSLK